MAQTIATAAQVAALYGVNISTVYRWIQTGQFTPAPQHVPSFTGKQDRYLFDREAVARQFRAEIHGERLEISAQLIKRLKAFTG
jgi:hypothetical protein